MKLTLLILFIIFIVLLIFTVYPVVGILRSCFYLSKGKKSKNYKTQEKKVKTIKNIKYPSKYNRNYFDYHTPIDKNSLNGTIFWIHGGAYVAGSKGDITKYATMLAAAGFQVINLNYALAPRFKYPTPLFQISEVYNFVKNNKEEYNFNEKNIYFAGDSAGAQIASQFVNIQVNKDYARKTKQIQTISNIEQIKGVILFCGVYDMLALMNNTKSKIVKFFYKRIGWAYDGSYNWQKKEYIKEENIIDNLTDSFPSCFVTDGNTFTFEEQSKLLVKTLKNKNVEVSEVFYSKEDKLLFHEYQFQMNTKEGQRTYRKLLEILNHTSIK